MIDVIPLLESAGSDRLVAHFAGRRGGVSEPPFDSLNLGFSTGDEASHVRDNRVRFCAAVGVPIDRLVVPGQIHGDKAVILKHTDAGEGALAPSERLRGWDAVGVATPGVFALSLTADCPLVVIADPERSIVGVAHAGWRRTAASVVTALVERVRAAGGRPSASWAAISPGIGACCYAVGREVVDALADLPSGGDAVSEHPAAGVRPLEGAPTSGGGWLDLRSIHRASLIANGFGPDRVHVDPACTACDPERFFSHRRDHGVTGRSGVIIGWRE